MGQGDAFLSPWEVVKLGYYTKQTIDYNFKDYSLADYSSRNTAGEILEVPISGTNEFFLVANRRKVSRYDVMMLGDTSHGDPFRDVVDYGKGIYVYHIVDGYAYDSRMDEECADGLYNWVQTGFGAPDWDLTNYWLPVLKPTSVSYNNEVTCVDGCPVTLNDCDDRNVRGLTNTTPSVVEGKWFSKGKKTAILNGDGTDRIFTNIDSNWTSRARSGDRYDAWNIGYNQIFSPYSSPNTKSWDNTNTGIFIYYSGLNNNIANLKIYRAGYGGYTEGQILAQTPPSKPMGIVVDYYFEGENFIRPIITWNHNMEPDMIRNDETKRYKIWRATHSSMANVPTNYTLLKTLDIDAGTDPSYIDTSVRAIGSGWPGMGEQIQYPIRYKVQAIDNYGDSSVRSNFGSVIGLMNCGYCAIGDMIHSESGEIPDKYKLYENYPNPFNPETKIIFDLPEDIFVNIKVYDILGKEIMVLINDFKQAGKYSISFNGSRLSSGVYYYHIKAGSFERVRKMILIK